MKLGLLLMTMLLSLGVVYVVGCGSSTSAVVSAVDSALTSTIPTQVDTQSSVSQ